MSVSYIFAGMQEFLAPQGDMECTVNPSASIDVALMTAAAPFGTDGSLPTLSETLAQVHHTRQKLEQQSHVQVVLNRRDLGQSSKIRVVLGLQCPPLGNPRDITRELWGAGVRVINPVGYKGMTPYGAGFAYPDAKLSLVGADLTLECVDGGFVLDLAHVGWNSARDVLRVTNLMGNVMISHSGCYDIYQHTRNTPRDIIETVFRQNGIFGLYGMTVFLSEHEEGDQPFYRHLKYLLALKRQIGKGRVGFGSDAVYRNWDTQTARRHWSNILKMAEKGDGSFGVTRCPPFPRQWSEKGLHLPKLIQGGLRKAGYEEKNRAAILGKDFFDFLLETLPT